MITLSKNVCNATDQTTHKRNSDSALLCARFAQMLDKGVIVAPGAQQSTATAGNSTSHGIRDPVGQAAELQRDVFKLATAALVCLSLPCKNTQNTQINILHIFTIF